MKSSVHSVCLPGDFTIKTVHAQKFAWKMRHTLKYLLRVYICSNTLYTHLSVSIKLVSAETLS